MWRNVLTRPERSGVQNGSERIARLIEENRRAIEAARRERERQEEALRGAEQAERELRRTLRRTA